jgi:type VI secretion system protein ImpE
MGGTFRTELWRLLNAADLARAHEVLVRAIQQEDSPWFRWLLLEVNALRGAWEPAQAQAAALVVLDPGRAGVYQVYERLAALMVHREAVWRGEQAPRCLNSGWLLWEERASLLIRLRDGDRRELAGLQRLDGPHGKGLSGQCDGRSFTSCTDRDARFAFGVEAMMEGEYWWLGWQEIQRIQLAGTGRKLRDLVWRPVMLSLRGGGVRQAFVPARYPGTEATSDRQCSWGAKPCSGALRAVNWGRGRGSCAACSTRADYQAMSR